MFLSDGAQLAAVGDIIVYSRLQIDACLGMVAPLLKSLAKEYKDQIAVYKVDTDKQKELSAVMGIQSLPTIIFIPKTGQPQIIIGAANKATFRKAIEEVLLKE